MSWLFSRALVEEYSAGTSLDGAPCAQLNVTPTQHKFWHNDKTMDASDLSQFGLTSRVLTDAHGAELLMSYLAAFPAKTSAAQAKVPASMESVVDSGSTWRASFAKWNHARSLWRTPQCSLLGDSDEFSETWPKWGSMRNGECLARTTPELYTSAKDSGFWPTVRASDGERGGRGDLIQAVRGNRNKHFKAHPDQRGQAHGERGPLNPAWLEWLMGWPIAWTALAPLETGRFHEWSRQHSICSPAANDANTQESA
jgi:hypothetical protein